MFHQSRLIIQARQIRLVELFYAPKKMTIATNSISRYELRFPLGLYYLLIK